MNWLAPLLLIAAQTAAPAVAPRQIDPKVAAQVPVIAGKLACKTIRSTGDEEIDALGCASMLACVRPSYPALKTIADGKATVDQKKRQIAAKLATLQPCMRQHRGQGIAELALKRGRA